MLPQLFRNSTVHLAQHHSAVKLQQVTEWHKKMEEARLQELRKGRELVVQKEEIRYLKNLVEEQERSIRSLEEDIVQQNMVREKPSDMSIDRMKFTKLWVKWIRQTYFKKIIVVCKSHKFNYLTC